MRVQPQAPPLDPPLMSLIKSQMWIPLYDIDGDPLMNSTN